MLFVSTRAVPARPLPATGFYFSSPGSAGSRGASLILAGCAESPAWQYSAAPRANAASAVSTPNTPATTSSLAAGETAAGRAGEALVDGHSQAAQTRVDDLAQGNGATRTLAEAGRVGETLVDAAQLDDQVQRRGGVNLLADAGAAWEQLAAQAQVDDPLQRRGTGLVAFASFGFAAAPPVFAVPRWVFGADAAGAWLTVAYVADAPRPDLAEFMRREAETWRVNSGMPLMNPANPSNAPATARIPVRPPENSGREQFEENVREAAASIRDGAANKIVLARRVVFPLVQPAPVAETAARLVATLSAKYRDCWVFSVGGLVGATPEMLLEARDLQDGDLPDTPVLPGDSDLGTGATPPQAARPLLGRDSDSGTGVVHPSGTAAAKRDGDARQTAGGSLVAQARVLAGTARPGEGVNLMESAKNRREHALAVASVVQPLRALLSERRASAASVDSVTPEIPGAEELSSNPGLAPHEPAVRTQPGVEAVRTRGPYLLELPNLAHLATEVTAEIPPGLTAFDLLGAIHPTAAVAGLPRGVTLEFIASHEPARGRYAGPVGWIDAQGHGQFALALRCAQVDERALTAWVGAGIMADSDPHSEFLETEAKLAPIRDCLCVH